MYPEILALLRTELGNDQDYVRNILLPKYFRTALGVREPSRDLLDEIYERSDTSSEMTQFFSEEFLGGGLARSNPGKVISISETVTVRMKVIHIIGKLPLTRAANELYINIIVATIPMPSFGNRFTAVPVEGRIRCRCFVKPARSRPLLHRSALSKRIRKKIFPELYENTPVSGVSCANLAFEIFSYFSGINYKDHDGIIQAFVNVSQASKAPARTRRSV